MLRCFVALLAVGCLSGSAAGQTESGQNPFEQEIRAFESTDSVAMPAPGGILFVGSSSIRLWNDLAAAFPGFDIVQRGFGGSQFSDLLHFADRIVFPYAPRLIVVYEGDNDVASGKSPARVYGDYREFVGRVRERLPGTRIAFIAIKPSIARWDRIESIRAANDLVSAHADTDSLLSFIDIATPMIGDDGSPRPELFVEDGLHLSRDGYALWSEVIRPHLE